MKKDGKEEKNANDKACEVVEMKLCLSMAMSVTKNFNKKQIANFFALTSLYLRHLMAMEDFCQVDHYPNKLSTSKP